MTIPDMGYLIANKYNVILMCLSLVQNMTILPLRSTPSVDIRQHRMISIGHVNGSHFVQVWSIISCLHLTFITFSLANSNIWLCLLHLIIFRLNYMMVVLYQW